MEGSSSNERKVKTVNFNFKKGSVVNNNRQEILNLHEKDKSTSQYTNTIQPGNSDFYLNRQRRHLEICIPSWEEIEKSEIERHNYNISTSHNKIYNQDSGLRNVESDCHYNSNKNKNNNNNNHEHKSNENSWQIHSDKSDHTTTTNKHATNSIKSVYPSAEISTSLTQKLLDRYKTNKQQSKKAESTRSDQFCQAKSRREAYNEILTSKKLVSNLEKLDQIFQELDQYQNNYNSQCEASMINKILLVNKNKDHQHHHNHHHGTKFLSKKQPKFNNFAMLRTKSESMHNHFGKSDTSNKPEKSNKFTNKINFSTTKKKKTLSNSNLISSKENQNIVASDNIHHHQSDEKEFNLLTNNKYLEQRIASSNNSDFENNSLEGFSGSDFLCPDLLDRNPIIQNVKGLPGRFSLHVQANYDFLSSAAVSAATTVTANDHYNNSSTNINSKVSSKKLENLKLNLQNIKSNRLSKNQRNMILFSTEKEKNNQPPNLRVNCQDFTSTVSKHNHLSLAQCNSISVDQKPNNNNKNNITTSSNENRKSLKKRLYRNNDTIKQIVADVNKCGVKQMNSVDSNTSMPSTYSSLGLSEAAVNNSAYTNFKESSVVPSDIARTISLVSGCSNSVVEEKSILTLSSTLNTEKENEKQKKNNVSAKILRKTKLSRKNSYSTSDLKSVEKTAMRHFNNCSSKRTSTKSLSKLGLPISLQSSLVQNCESNKNSVSLFSNTQVIRPRSISSTRPLERTNGTATDVNNNTPLNLRKELENGRLSRSKLLENSNSEDTSSEGHSDSFLVDSHVSTSVFHTNDDNLQSVTTATDSSSAKNTNNNTSTTSAYESQSYSEFEENLTTFNSSDCEKSQNKNKISIRQRSITSSLSKKAFLKQSDSLCSSSNYSSKSDDDLNYNSNSANSENNTENSIKDSTCLENLTRQNSTGTLSSLVEIGLPPLNSIHSMKEKIHRLSSKKSFDLYRNNMQHALLERGRRRTTTNTCSSSSTKNRALSTGKTSIKGRNGASLKTELNRKESISLNCEEDHQKLKDHNFINHAMHHAPPMRGRSYGSYIQFHKGLEKVNSLDPKRIQSGTDWDHAQIPKKGGVGMMKWKGTTRNSSKNRGHAGQVLVSQSGSMKLQ